MKEPKKNDRPASGAGKSLDDLLVEAGAGLGRAVADARHEWHLPVVATVDRHGMPQARTVVLRGFEPGDEDPPVIVFHTDRRSGKIEDLARDDRVGMLFYERRHKVQLRIEGRASVHLDDEVAAACWARTSASSRRCYLAPHPPSSPRPAWESNLPDGWTGKVPPLEVTEPGKDCFAVIRVQVTSIDRLELHHDGHVRSRWTWATSDGATRREATWLAP